METVCLVLTTLSLRLKGHGSSLGRSRRLGEVVEVAAARSRPGGRQGSWSKSIGKT